MPIQHPRARTRRFGTLRLISFPDEGAGVGLRHGRIGVGLSSAPRSTSLNGANILQPNKCEIA